MSTRDQKLESLGYPLDKITSAGPVILPLAIDGDTVYVSGHVPFDGSELKYVGKVPSQVSLEDAKQAAALCTANILRVLYRELGTLDKVERILKVTGFVNTDPDFTDCHLVINGASAVLTEVLGEAGRHARAALGMGQLPLGVSVEVEMILKIKA